MIIILACIVSLPAQPSENVDATAVGKDPLWKIAGRKALVADVKEKHALKIIGGAEAELFDEVTVEHFLETKGEWRPIVVEAAKRMVQSGSSRESVPRHFQWDCTSKQAYLRMLAYSFFCRTGN